MGLHGVASGVTVDEPFALIQSGGTARNLQATDGTAVIISAGGTTTGTRSSGPLPATRTFPASAHGTIISSCALLTSQAVDAGGVAIGAIVSSGGNQVVFSGGVASGADVLNGGSQVISGSGRAVGTEIASAGV